MGKGSLSANKGVKMDYNKACESASADQGITAIGKELEFLNIAYEVDQTGGFTMVGRVAIDANADFPYLGFTPECVVMYKDEEDEGLEVMASFDIRWDGDNKLVFNAISIARTIQTILGHYHNVANEYWECLACAKSCELSEGRIVVQSETFAEFYCSACKTRDADLTTKKTYDLKKTISVPIGGEVFVFYSKESHGAWYQVGTNGEVGSFYMPMNKDGSPDIENVGEIEVIWEEA